MQKERQNGPPNTREWQAMSRSDFGVLRWSPLNRLLCNRVGRFVPPHPNPLPKGEYVSSVFDKCPPLPARYERGEGRGGGSPNINRRCSLLSPALSSLRGGEGEENSATLNTYKGEGTACQDQLPFNARTANFVRGDSDNRRTILPLPWGEGRGEGKQYAVCLTNLSVIPFGFRTSDFGFSLCY